MSPVRVGDVVAERFEVEELAGAGGAGQVYRARDRVEGGYVALKVLQPPSSRDTGRFAREVRALAKLHHPSIVRYIAHGQTAEGEPYLAMEWLDGEDLAARLARPPALEPAASVDLLRRVAEALAVAHAHGVIHRDIKPSNLFLRGGRLDDLKVLDFGLAWLVDASRELTRAGFVVGTLGYMAPEQAVGERMVDARADVFSLGCVLYQCLTGHPPFESDRIGAVLMKILHEDPPRVSELVRGIPAELDDLVARMLAKEPAARPADGADVAGHLAALLPELPTSSEALAAVHHSSVALTHAERRLACFIAVGTQRNWLATGAYRLVVLFDAGSEVLDRARVVVRRHGGNLDVLADGSLLVTLSGGTSATDLAARAARCALALRPVLPSAPIAVAMGRSDQGSGRVVGATIDMVAEMLSATTPVPGDRTPCPEHGPGPIRIDETTAGLLDPSFEIGGDERGLFLLGENTLLERPRLLLGKPAPFVGREREMAALRGIFEECAADSVSRAMLVTGPSGTGKSRVRKELVRMLRERGEPPEIWLAAGQPIAPGAPFSVMAGLVRSMARLAPEDLPAVRRHKLSARVGRHLDGEHADRVAAFLGEIAALPFPEEGEVGTALRAARAEASVMVDQVRQAWQDLVAAECAAQPLVLVLDDLQWGDSASMTVLMSALRRLHDRPLLLVGFGRPEIHDLFPKLTRDTAVQGIRLGELTPRASEHLLRAVVGDTMPAGDVASIVERAGGNPFYLEELLRGAVEGHGYALPETVLAMVQARLEGLDPEARRVLRAASIFGSRFYVAGVRELLGEGGPQHDLTRWIEMLVEAELIEHPRTAWENGGESSFRHAIVRDAVYATLAEHDRRLGHRLAAAWLEHASGDDAATIARHFALGGEPLRAATWHLAAAEAALAGPDLRAAIDQAELGVACGATGELLGALRGVEMRAHALAGDPAAAEKYVDETLALLPVGGARWCNATAVVGLLAMDLGRWDRLFDTASALLAERPQPSAWAEYLAAASAFGILFHALGLHDRAELFCDPLDQLLAHLPEADPFATGWVNLAQAFHAGTGYGDPWGQREHAKVAAAAFERVGDRANQGNARMLVGLALIAMGAYEQAASCLRETVAMMDQAGMNAVAAQARSQLARALVHAGQPAEARAEAAEAVRLAMTTHNPHIELVARRLFVQILLDCGDIAAAEAEADALGPVAQTLPTARPTPVGQRRVNGIAFLPEAETAVVLAWLHYKRGRTTEAVRTAGAAMAWLDTYGGIDHSEWRLRLVYVEALEATGQLETAAKERAKARERLREVAERIADPEMRASFLTKVPANARLWAEAS